MKEFRRNILRMVVGHCGLNIGWHNIQASSLDLLTDVLEKYIVEIAQATHRYSEQFGRSEPNLDDLGLAFKEMGILVHDLSEFTSNVEPIPFPQDISRIPVPKESCLNFLKPGNPEVVSRPVHIFDYLPPMQTITCDTTDFNEDQSIKVTAEFPEQAPTESLTPDALQTPTVSSKTSLFKRPESTDKLRGLSLLEEGLPYREIASVMMTTSGYLSSSREGKVAESKISKNFFDDSEVHVEKKTSVKRALAMSKKLEEVPGPIERQLSQAIDKRSELTEKSAPVEIEKDHGTELTPVSEVSKEKEKPVEKEKPKKKRPKQVMEEFAFFEKDKGKSSSVKSQTADTVKQSPDPAKKLSIFKKLPKSRAVESPIVPVDAKHEKESPSKFSISQSQEYVQKTVTEHVDSLKLVESRLGETEKALKKEKRVNKKKEKLKIRESSLEERLSVDSFKVDSDLMSPSTSGQRYLPDLPHAPVESPLVEVEREPTEHSKKKRARSSASHLSEKSTESVDQPIPPNNEGSFSQSSKMFFPFQASFPVPNVIPPQIFPNVPFNLLGMPLGVRPLLGNLAPQAPSLNNAPSGRMPSIPAGNSQPDRLSPCKSPPNIVDSLPDAGETSSPMETFEDPNVLAKKKDKRDKKDKEKKKKEKKYKDKDKDDDKKSKRDKKKEKKEKEKNKNKDKDEVVASVPKITFKFGAASSSSSPCATVETTPKLIIKPVADRDLTRTPTGPSRDLTSPPSPSSSVSSVEVAKFSALVTRPPKVTKPPKKDAGDDKLADGSQPSSLQPQVLPHEVRSPSPKPSRMKQSKPPKVVKDREKDKKKTEKVGDVAIITETVGSYYDEFGNKIWICPACGRQDDGTPMIGCDECDDWYHWVCVGIRVPPAETESWFCQRCIAKKQGGLREKKKGRKKKSL